MEKFGPKVMQFVTGFSSVSLSQWRAKGAINTWLPSEGKSIRKLYTLPEIIMLACVRKLNDFGMSIEGASAAIEWALREDPNAFDVAHRPRFLVFSFGESGASDLENVRVLPEDVFGVEDILNDSLVIPLHKTADRARRLAEAFNKLGVEE